MQNAPPFAVPSSVRFEDVYDEHLEFVRRSIQRRGVPTVAVDDVTQEVFAAVFLNLSTFSGDKPLKHWISGVMRNVVAMYFRRRENRVRNVPLDEEQELDALIATDTPEDHAERASLREQLTDALMRMTEGQRQAFWLYAIEELPGSQVAARLGISENTVRMRMRSARRWLQSVQLDEGAADDEDVPDGTARAS